MIGLLGATGHGWRAALWPLGAAIIAAVFGATLAARFVRRRRPHEGAWAVAMAMFAAGSFAMFLGVAGGWTSLDYRVYWLFGAVLNVPYLFQGELYLLLRRRAWGHLALAAQLALSALAVWQVAAGALDAAALGTALPLGKDAWIDALPYRMAQYYALPAYFLLLGGLAWSTWQMRDAPALRNRTAGTLLIAAGATVVAIGSGIGAARHIVPLFSVSLAAGIAAMFWGFVRAGRPVGVE